METAGAGSGNLGNNFNWMVQYRALGADYQYDRGNIILEKHTIYKLRKAVGYISYMYLVVLMGPVRKWLEII